MKNKMWWKKTGIGRTKAVILAAMIGVGCTGASIQSMAEETVSESVEMASENEDALSQETEDVNEEETASDTDGEETDSEEVEGDDVAVDAEEENASSTTSPEEAGFSMSTTYPGVTAKAGDTVTFNLDFASVSGAEYDLTLSVQNLPEGWSGYYSGSSNEISRIHINEKSAESDSTLAKYNLTIPEDVEEGTYVIDLTATPSDGGIAYLLSVEIEISETLNGEGSFTTEYPEQQGASGTAFSFDGTIINNRATAQSYALSAQAETGWQVSFTPSGESSQVASINVDPGSSQGLTISITPPETIKEGEYTIPCTAISADETLTMDLKVIITGSYEVVLSTPSGNLSVDAYANQEKKVTLTVTNTGNTDLENLNLSSSASTDWEVSFDESTIDLLEAGTSKEITATIKPSQDSITGDYVTQITVSNDIVSSSAQFRVSVKTRTSWGITAVAIIVLLVAGVCVVFRKYGRR